MNREQFIAARRRKGLSQERAAQLIGVSRATISAWERGKEKPYPFHLPRICEVYGISESDVDSDQGSDNTLLTLLEHGLVTRRTLLSALGSLPLLLDLHAEETLSLCALGLPALWQLYYAGQMEHVVCLLPLYKRLLTAIVHQPSALQKQIAGLTSQVHQLTYEIAIDQEQYTAVQEAAQCALLYARAAEDPCLQVSALLRIGDTFFHQRQPTHALHAFQQASSLLPNVTPLLRGRTYVGLAEVQGMRGAKQEALTAIAHAQEHYPTLPEQDPAYHFTHYSHYSLYVFGQGQTRLFLNQPKEAAESFVYVEQHLLDPHHEPLSRVDLWYYHALAAIQLGNQEQAVHAVREAATLARALGSKLYYQKIAGVFAEMQRQWKHEPQVLRLAEVFQPW